MTTVIKTTSDLDAFKAATLTEYCVVGRIGACTVHGYRQKRNGKPYVTFKLGRRRASYAKLVEIIGYL